MSAHSPHSPTTPRGRLAGSGLVAVALTASVVAVSAGTASAAPNETTQANAAVLSGITLTDLTAAFTLTGTPGATVTTAAPVTYNVETNNPTGYTVTVQSATASMVPADTVANPDVIPIGVLRVRETGPGAYSPVTTTGGAAVTVHTQGGRSANAGDLLSTEYQMRIPNVNDDTYSATLNYLAATTA